LIATSERRQFPWELAPFCIVSSISWRESAPPILRQTSFRIGADAVVTAQSIERQNGATQAP
jgi:hypothetical protein